MSTSCREHVRKTIRKALDLKDRVERGPLPDFEAEHAELLATVDDAVARRWADYMGDEKVFLGARYALACWIDELFSVLTPAPWSAKWVNKPLEFILFKTAIREFEFWRQLDIALKRMSAPKSTVPTGPDALEAFYLCITLGFRGRYRNDPSEVRKYIEELRPQFIRAAPWMERELEDHAKKGNIVTTPLVGRREKLRTLWVHGVISVVLLIATLVLGIVWRALSSSD